MLSPTKNPRYDDLTLGEARSMRIEQAKLTALYAKRVEAARAASQHGAVAYWRYEYRQSARKCRLLGERIRGEWRPSSAPVDKSAANVVRLSPRAATRWPDTGRVA